jgi:uncharacterized membrane protein YvlD (DUF360 family)
MNAAWVKDVNGRYTEAMIAISLIVDVVLTAILLKIVSSALPDFEMDGMGPAFIAVLIASVVGFAAQFVVLPFLAPYLAGGGWMAYAVSPALSSVTLAVGIAFAPGIRAGILSILLGAVIVSVAISGLMFVIGPLLVRGLAL